MNRCVLLVLMLSMPWATNAAEAPAGDPVVSLATGTRAFITVTEEQATAGKLKGGLYRRDKTSWKHILTGPLLTDDEEAPVVRQLEIGQMDKSGIMLVVSEGYLQLVTTSSDPKVAESILKLGSNELPLKEVTTGQKRILSPITDAENLSIYVHESVKSGMQAVLVSVKLGEQSVLGEGVTYAFVVKANTKKSKIELQLQPRILDYKFHSPGELASLIVEKSDGQRIVYSQNLVDQFETQLEQNEPELTAQLGRQWDRFLTWSKEKLAELLSPHIALDGDPVPLAYDLIFRRPINNIQFEENWYVNGLDITQVFFPTQARGEVRIDANGEEITVPGVIEMNGSQPLVSFAEAADEATATLFFMGKTGKLLFQSGSTDGMVELQLDGLPNSESIKNIALFLSELPEDDVEGNPKRHLTISFELTDKKGTRGVTQVATIEELPSSVLLAKPYEVLQFYVPQDQLGARHQLSDDNHILFDSLTPAVDSLEAYNLTVDVQAPRMNLSLSSNFDQVFQYVQAQKIAQISDSLFVAFFPETPGVNNPSGVFIAADGSEIKGLQKNAVRGEILVRNLEEGEKVEDLPDRRLPLLGMKLSESSFGEQSRNITVFALDPNRNGGKSGFALAIAANVAEENEYRLALAQLPAFPFSQLVGVKILRGKKEHHNKVLIAVSGVSGKKEFTSVTILDLIQLGRQGAENGPLVLPKGNVVFDKALDDTELSSRFRFSESGVPYFVRTLEIAEDSTHYEVYDVLRGNVLKPAILKGAGKIKFMSEDEAKDGDETFGATYLDQSISWRLYRDQIEKMFGEKSGLLRELAQFEAFKELIAVLDRMADPNATPERRILVLPDALRPLIWDFIGAVYLAEARNKRGFSKENFNADLSVFQHPKSVQENFFANFEYYKAKRKTPNANQQMLIAQMSEILQNPLPLNNSGEANFEIDEVSADSNARAGSIAKNKTKRVPHALYLLSSETPKSIEEFRNEKPAPSIPSLILATPEEMQMLEGNAAAEIDAGLLETFKITEIKNPDRESMFTSLAQIFNDEDVKRLETEFDASEIRKKVQLSKEESFSTVLEYMISRFEALVASKNQSIFESFMRLRSAFSAALFSDRQFRRSRKLDKFFVERVLTQIFDIPVNLSTLPEDDPLRILSRRDAALKLQEAGYAGPFDLKQKVIRVILSQTQADAGKPIPSSIILFGETGAGKTFMFKTLVKMLGLKTYDFNGRTDEQEKAGAMIINVGQLNESGMNVETVLEHADQFLGFTNGRGFLLIDDAHANDDAVKGKILAWIRNLFESPNGMYTTESGKKVPVRNLTVMMTMNPTADQQQIKKYAKDESKPTTEERIIATLSSSNFKVEPSLLKRWGAIISLDLMPAGAKGPELINALGAASREQLTTSGRIGLVDPRVVSQIVNLTTSLDARTFLSASVNELMAAVNDAQSSGSIAMVVPSRSVRLSEPVGGSILDGNQTAAEQIRSWVMNNTRVIALDQSVEGRLSLMKLIVDAYRTPVYEFLVDALMSDMRFAGDEFNQRRLLTPILLAVNDHIALRSSVPLQSMNLSALDFGMRSQRERENFRDIVDRMTDTSIPFIPITFGQAESSANVWQSLLAPGAQAADGLSRKELVYQTSEKIARVTLEHLNRILNTDDVLSIKNEAEWMVSLPASDHKDIREIGKELTNFMWEYLPRMLDDHLKEARAGAPTLNSYAAARLFLYALDRAILKLPWVAVNNLMLKSLDLVSQDQVLSQAPGIQGFMFTNRYRLLKPTTSDLINQIVESSSTYQEATPSYRERLRSEFNDNCKLLLSVPAVEGGA